MADAKDGENVDIVWLINHIWYLSVGISRIIDHLKYKDCIQFIQKTLIKKFNIDENIKEKVSRKIYTRTNKVRLLFIERGKENEKECIDFSGNDITFMCRMSK